MTPTATTSAAKPEGQNRTGRQTAADLAFCARALKAPALLDAAERLAERAQLLEPRCPESGHVRF